MNLPSPEDFNEKLTEQEESLPTIVESQNAYWKTTAQYQALLKEEIQNPIIKLGKTPRRFTPVSLSYIRTIRIYCDNPDKAKGDITLTVKKINTPPHEIELSTSKDKTFLYGFISSFCDWFEIHTDAKLFKPQIKKIKVLGANDSTLQKYSDEIDNYYALKLDSAETIRKAEQEYKDLLSSIKKSEDLIAATEVQITECMSKKVDLSAELGILKETIEEKMRDLLNLENAQKQATENLTSTRNNTEQLTQKSSNLNKEITNLTSTLEKLTSDRNLISDEYGPYVKEGKSQATIYVLIATLPLAAIIFSIYEIYQGASKLLTSEYTSALDVFAAFILRIPFAAVFGLAIYYSWKLTSVIVQKILKIHNDRLTLAKLLIIAREVVHSSSKNLDVPDIEKFQEQVTLKIEVLKSHLARELGEDFKYEQKSKRTDTPSSAKNTAANDDLDTTLDVATEKNK